ncbi:MAG: ribonuclease M5 [Firmicutes bacterium]|nr:ribonuclease M5 [Bacillota bacterium]
MDKLKVKEAIVVEGRDDTIAVKRAVDGLTIETHGFGIRKETWQVIEKAYNEQGIIIFTDPDFSGEEIRRRLTAKFPDAKQAFLARTDATKKGDIGIENAEPEAIIEALQKAHCTAPEREDIFTEADLFEAGLVGRDDSRQRREILGKILGIGYGNGKSLLNKLNKFSISRESFAEAVDKIEDK